MCFHKKIIVWLTGLLLASVAGAQTTKVGVTAANFITIPVGAKAASMGGAFTAVADDASALFWNPAGISRLQQSEASIMYVNWLVDTDLSWAGAAFRMNDLGFGFAISQLDYGSEDVNTAANPYGTGETWSARDLSMALSFAMNLTDRFSFGAAGKYIQQKIWHEEAQAVAFDVGLLFSTRYNGLKIGMNISNFGTEIQMDGKDLMQPVDIDESNAGNNANIVARMQTDSWPLPLFFTVGLSMDVIRSDSWLLRAAVDATHPNNQSPFVNMGAEWTWQRLFSLRAGYNSLFRDYAEQGLTLGVGIEQNFGGTGLRFEYGYMDFGVFKAISRYSFSVMF